MHVTKACPHLKLHSHPDIHDAMDGAINKTAKPKMINDECTDESFSAMVKNKKHIMNLTAFSLIKETQKHHSPPQPFSSVDYRESPLSMLNIHMRP